MKFGSWTVVLIALLAVSPWPASAQNPITTGSDFRGARWGQSQIEIEELEGKAPFRRDRQVIMFHGDFQGTPTEVIYFFNDDKLVMGFTHLLASHDDLDLYFTDYELVKSSLEAELGAPVLENWQKSLPELETDRSMWPEALGFGLIKAEAGWLLKDTVVALRLSGANFRGHIMTVFFSQKDLVEGRRAYKEYFAQQIGVPNKYFQK
jgi:hypothetical protein